MNISDRAQEILEKYWITNKEQDKAWRMDIISDDPIAAELIDGHYSTRDGNHLELTEKGWDESRSCVRRHRLAERLLTDVLDVKPETIHGMSCKFEHLLQKDVEENICTLLGHPRKCPHGRSIPEGDCCRDSERMPRKMVIPLSECEADDKGKIVYIKTGKDHTMNKLTAMGVLPGLTIELLAKTPSYLFRMGESQFAIDRELAEKIQVRLSKEQKSLS